MVNTPLYKYDLKTDVQSVYGSHFDEKSIAHTWDLFYVKGHCLEIRTFKNDAVASGYFDDKTKFIEEAKRLGKIAEGTYVTVNPVRRDLLARYPKNQMSGNWKAKKSGLATNEVKRLQNTNDDDIRIEASIFIDLDISESSRPAGTSSKSGEINQALLVAKSISDFFKEKTIPYTIGMSGNGIHIIILLPLTPFSKERVRLRSAFYDFIKERFENDTIKVDVAVKNPSRVTKLYGTAVRKGISDENLGRIHRVSYTYPRTPIVLAISFPIFLRGVGRESHGK